MKDTIRLGIAGACGRGRSFRLACDSLENIRIVSVCDIDDEKLHDTALELGADHEFTEYGDMLESGGIDAVVIATPMPLHVPQAIQALRRDIHVLS